MSGLYNTYKVFSPGEILTAADLNASEQQHVVYNTALATGGFSETLDQSRVQADAITLSLSMADELARLREKIRLLGGTQYWDQVLGPSLTPPMPKAQVLLPLEGALLPDGSAGNAFPGIVERVSTLTPTATGSPKVIEIVYDFDATTPQFLMWKFVTPLGYKPGDLIECSLKISMAENVITGNFKPVAGIVPVTDDMTDVSIVGVTLAGSDVAVPAVFGQQHEYRISVANIGVLEDQKCVVVIGMQPATTDNATGKRRLEAATIEFSRGLFTLPDPGMPNPMTTIGDIIIGGSSGSPVRLALGAPNQVLTADSVDGIPKWLNPVTGFTNPMTAAGDLIQGGATGIAARLPVGTDGQVLTVVSNAPVWINSPAMINPMTVNGDLIAQLGGTYARLPIGSENQIFAVVGGLPTWIGAPFIQNVVIARGDLVTGDSLGAPVRLPVGTTNQILTAEADGDVAWRNETGFANPMTTPSDIIVGGVAGLPTRFGIGSNGQVLTVAAGAVIWQTPTALVNPMTTLGDVIVGGASGVPTRLGIGANTQVLTLVGGVPTWQAPLSGGMTNPMTAIGDVIIGSTAGSPIRLAAGTNGFILTLVGGSPAWAVAPVGFINPMTGVGDLIRGGASGVATRLAPGSDGTWLTLTAGVPTWTSLPVDPGFANPMTGVGDIIRGGTSGAPTRLAPGSNGNVLTLSSGIPAWVAAVGFANPMTTQADIITGGASGVPTRLAKGGTVGHVLTMTGASAIGWAAVGGATTPVRLLMEGTTLPTTFAPYMIREESTGTQVTNGPKVTRTYINFPKTEDRSTMWGFLIPPNWTSGGTIRGKWKAELATSGNVIWKAAAVATTDASSDDDASVFNTVTVSAASAAPATQGQSREFTIALTTTGFAANRWLTVFIGRDTDHASDTMTDGAILMGAQFEYA